LTRDEFAALAMACLEEVTSLACRLSRNPADADDLVQGTFERAFRFWRQLRKPEACRAWLFQIARNLHLSRLRYTAGHPELQLVEEDEGFGLESAAPPELIERLEARDLEKALERLPADQREAVLLCDLWGFEYQEIASITGWPLGTVRSRIARGRAKLASLLAAWGAGARGGRP